MRPAYDGPASPYFTALPIEGNVRHADLRSGIVPDAMASVAEHAPSGHCVGWGVPFDVDDLVLVAEAPVTVRFPATLAPWLIFMHTADQKPMEGNEQGLITPMRGQGQLNEHVANYVMAYEDGTEMTAEIRRRHQIGAFQRIWGENCFQAVAHHKPYPLRAAHEQLQQSWGQTQTRVENPDAGPWVNWLWAWQNPNPAKRITGIRFEPVSGLILVFGISAGNVSTQPLRWRRRQKALLTLPEGETFRPELDDHGLLEQIQLDLGQVISAQPRLQYPDPVWRDTYNNQLPEPSLREVLIEYTGHPDACFHIRRGLPSGDDLVQELIDYAVQAHGLTLSPETAECLVPEVAGRKSPKVGRLNLRGHNIETGRPEEVWVERDALQRALYRPQFVPVREVEQSIGQVEVERLLTPVPPATQRVTLHVVERSSGYPVAVKLHVHGRYDEYLAPLDRHRIVNTAWFEDYSVDFAHRGTHQCTYISGETTLDLPLGDVYVEVSKGFEIEPLRRVVTITPETDEVVVEIERVLPWREKGWVTADTHVHFPSPMSAQLEGAGEGVNVVNLLASQWGELMTNVGDFDGATTWGSREAGGTGEYLVRVGTENRQHVLGHISLLGYRGSIIAPMTTGGPDESALGDPIEILLTEWARQCHRQGGLVVLPHFPNPRAEHAASIISGDIDALEMTSWGDLYSGINPYSLSDWYRYLNCGYMVAAVGGTDKMSADTAVGTVRTYAHLDPDQPFSYEAWMDAVRRAETFVTYGPLLEFKVDGHPMGTRIEMGGNGGTVDVVWQAASVTVPMSRVELVVNGEIRESVAVDPRQASGSWSVRIDRSSWLALLVRGHYADKPEIVAAHSSPVMVTVEGSQMLAAADAVTILEQIEGALAYLDTIGTRAEDRAYKRMRLVLESAHRGLHNRMHRLGYYHDHTPTTDHPEHH
ncbi:MAG: CehA/McbA family metallohydrolase [Anaerolineae bacterium]